MSQSHFCDDYLDSLDKKYSKINFINNKKAYPKTEIYIKKRTQRTQILYVGTVKELGARRYYYESSPEFFGSIFEIYNKISKYKNKTWNIANETWINALLSNPKTHIINMTSN